MSPEEDRTDAGGAASLREDADCRAHVHGGGPWEDRYGYARAVRVGAWIYVSGTTATDPDGGVLASGDAGAQAREIFRQIERALMLLGASMVDVVRTRMYAVDIAADADAISRVHAEVFGDVRPAATLVEVKALIDPEHRVEIEVEAYIGG